MIMLKISRLGLIYLFVIVLSLFIHLHAYALENIDDIVEDTPIFREVEEVRNTDNYILVDRITNDKNMITGKTLKNSMIKFTINNVEYTSNSDEEGNFTLLIEEGLLVDVDQINIRVCDYLGNDLSNLSFVVYDVLPPIDPIVSDVINNSDSIIRGYGEPNCSIKVIVGEDEFISNISTAGYFEVNVGDALRDADILELISYDYFNNYSNMVKRNVKDVISPDKPIITSVDFANNTIYGIGERECEIIVGFDEKKYRSFIDANGYFIVNDDEGLLESTDHIKVQVIDLSGNKSEEVLFEIEKQNVGSIALKSLEPNNRIIRDAIIKLNGVDEYTSDEDKVFNLNNGGHLVIEDLPFGDYELVIRYRTTDNKIEENFINVSLDGENSEVEILID